MGGTIGVHSDGPGKGSEVWFTMPVHATGRGRSAPPSAVAVPSGGGGSSGGSNSLAGALPLAPDRSVTGSRATRGRRPSKGLKQQQQHHQHQWGLNTTDSLASSAGAGVHPPHPRVVTLAGAVKGLRVLLGNLFLAAHADDAPQDAHERLSESTIDEAAGTPSRPPLAGQTPPSVRSATLAGGSVQRRARLAHHAADMTGPGGPGGILSPLGAPSVRSNTYSSVVSGKTGTQSSFGGYSARSHTVSSVGGYSLHQQVPSPVCSRHGRGPWPLPRAQC